MTEYFLNLLNNLGNWSYLLQDKGNTFVEFLEASMKAFLEEHAINNSTDNSRSDQRG